METCAYISLMVVALVIVVYLSSKATDDYLIFARDKKLPGSSSFITGTVFSFLALSYVVYNTYSAKLGNTKVLLSFIFFLVFYSVWFINVMLAAEHHRKGAIVTTNAGVYMVLCILLSLYVCYNSWYVAPLVFTFSLLPLMWCMYLIYRWWFRHTVR